LQAREYQRIAKNGRRQIDDSFAGQKTTKRRGFVVVVFDRIVMRFVKAKSRRVCDFLLVKAIHRPPQRRLPFTVGQ
jgi:hypothetical protein